MILFRIIVAVLFVSLCFPQTSRPRISKSEDLPRFSYAVTVPTAELLASDSAYGLLARPLRADLDALLRDYEISDKATLIHLLSCRYELEANAGDYGSALRDLLQARDLQEKPGQKLAWRIDDETAIRARSKVQSDDSAWQKAFNKEFRDKLASLPWGDVETDIKGMKAEYQLSAPKIVVSRLTTSLDPIIQKNHAINFDHACRIVDNRNWVHYALRLRTDVIEILGSYVSAHRQPQPDIWVSRNFDLTDRDPAQPVGIGIWDGGVDLSVFPRQLAARAKGPSYDFDDNPSSDLLLPLDPDLRQHLPEIIMYTRGRHDIEESIDSPEAAALGRKMINLEPREYKTFIDQLTEFSDYMHGTHVAGIAVRGNPYARLAAVRYTADYLRNTTPQRLTLERAKRDVSQAEDFIRYFGSQNTRVVNMSWRDQAADWERSLEANGVGKDPAERKEMAHKMFTLYRDGLRQALASAPEILFICVAGNDNQDSTFQESIPASFVLPNLLTVGAVDQSGRETPFTSYGSTVAVHANGYEVESFIPGGGTMRASGTSMAAPAVTNLAAKLFALDPSLKPTEVIDLIKSGADRSADDHPLLINPRHSVELLRGKNQSGAAARAR